MRAQSRLLLGLFLLCACSSCIGVLKKIAIIHSYTLNWEHVQEEEDGIFLGLTTGGYDREHLEVRSFWMDTKDFYTSDLEMEQRGALALELIETFRPDVVVTTDDNALRWVSVEYVRDGIGDVPFVFCGVNGDPDVDFADIIPSSGQITGSLERDDYNARADLVATWNPFATEMHIILDNTTTSRAVVANTLSNYSWSPQVLSRYGSNIFIHNVEYFDDLQSLIANLSSNNVYPALLWKSSQRFVNRSSGLTIPAVEVYEWLFYNNPIPGVGVSARDGFLAGSSVNNVAMCSWAGLQAAGLLDGKPMGDFPITNPNIQVLSFNLPRADQLGYLLDPLSIPSAIVHSKVPGEDISGPVVRVYVCHSYDEDWQWSLFQQSAFLQGLEKKGFAPGSYRVQQMYMDLKVTHLSEESRVRRAEIALMEIEQWQPDVIFTTDDLALEYVGIPSAQLNRTVVFSGVNGRPEEQYPEVMSSPHRTITGVLERIDWAVVFYKVAGLDPSATVVHTVADATISGQAVVAELRTWLDTNGTTLPFDVVIHDGVPTFREFQKEVKGIQGEGNFMLLITYQQLRDEDGLVVSRQQVIHWLHQHSFIGELSINLLFAQEGGLAAVGPDPSLFAQIAGAYAARMLGGQNATSLDVVDPGSELQGFTFNRARFDQLDDIEPSLGALVQARTFSQLLDDGESGGSSGDAGYTGGEVAAIVVPLLMACCVCGACCIVIVVSTCAAVVAIGTAERITRKRRRLIRDMTAAAPTPLQSLSRRFTGISASGDGEKDDEIRRRESRADTIPVQY